MFSPFDANGAATHSLRIACRRAAEQQARQARDEPAPAPRRGGAGRRAAAGAVLAAVLGALLPLAWTDAGSTAPHSTGSAHPQG